MTVLGVHGYSRVIHFLFPFSEIFIPCHHCVELSSFGFCKDSLLVLSSVAFVNWFGLAKNIDSFLPFSVLDFLLLSAPWRVFFYQYCSNFCLSFSWFFIYFSILIGDAIYFSSQSLYVLLSSIEFTGSFSSYVLIGLNRPNMFFGCCIHDC